MVNIDTLIAHGYLDNTYIEWPHNIYQYIEFANKHNITPVLVNSEYIIERDKLQVLDIFTNRERLFDVKEIAILCAVTYKPCIIKKKTDNIFEIFINNKHIYADTTDIYYKLLANEFQLAERNLSFMKTKWHENTDSVAGTSSNVYRTLESIIQTQ